MVDAPQDPTLEGPTAPTMSPGHGDPRPTFHVGQILGNRYEIRSRLGSGGMGEVWLATDLKLRTDVALKSVRPDYLANAGLREALRREVLAAREVLSPNVCRVFDLQVMEGHELVAMEYVAGRTLADLFKERTPLPLREGRDLAAQFLAGLEAIHDAGLVHRDFKPENVMVTPVGRVVVMDLGLAARPAVTGGRVAGTPAYMSPEQERGEELDARTDVFAAGIVLAEMIAPAGTRDRGKRVTLWEGLRAEPPRIPEGAWTPVIRKAVSSEPSERYGSARELSRELDGLTLRVEEGEGVEPYPGLEAFTAENAERFFGREAEVEAFLRKLGHARLLALAGPSGAGKTSFVQAGLIPALPEEWAYAVVHPGDGPFVALSDAVRAAGGRGRQRFAHEDADAIVEALRAWREEHGQALLVLDQFEELFTLNPPDRQSAFAQLLGRLPLEADVHVLLSMRDDFLLRCRDHEALAPAFADLTPLVHPTGAALRRALVQPALSCGYRFEDEALVEAMLGQVEHERGALPLLAFAAARLWAKRDRDEGLLTRAAHEEIGGVGGALAHHAEETLERIGERRTPIVRELFRNLVTAEGTRAARDRDELLSLFAEGAKADGDPAGHDPRAAEEVLDALVDARLLICYEVGEAAGGSSRELGGTDSTVPLDSSTPSHVSSSGETARRMHRRIRIEIIHESLLSAWPRLVRWRTQDAGAAQQRDELRQAAQAWDERGRPEHLLWTETAYLEHRAWRARYPGRLTAVEEEYAGEMGSLAGRVRRRRRLAAGLAFAAVVGVALVTGKLWLDARDQARRAEAARLLAVGQQQLDADPTVALAYAMASLEQADNKAARLFALATLQRGPTYRAIPLETGSAQRPVFSPDGEWLAAAGMVPTAFVLHQTGREPLPLTGHSGDLGVEFGPEPGTVLTADDESLRFWSLSSGALLRTEDRPSRGSPLIKVRGADVFVLSRDPDRKLHLRQWLNGRGPPRTLRHPPGPVLDIDPKGARLLYSREHNVYLRSASGETAGALVSRHPEPVGQGEFHPGQNWVAVSGRTSSRLESLEEGEGTIRAFDGSGPWMDPTGAWLVTDPSDDAALYRLLWDLQGPDDGAPIELKGDSNLNGRRFHPSGRWLATGDSNRIRLWPLSARYGTVLRREGWVTGLAFTPDSQKLLGVANGGATLWQWPLSSGPTREVAFPEGVVASHGAIALDPNGEKALISTTRGALVWPLGGEPSRELVGFGEGVSSRIEAVAFGPQGRLAAAGAYHGPRAEKVIRVWDVETGEVLHRLGPLPEAEDGGFAGGIFSLVFLPDGRLLSASAGGLDVWSLQGGEPRRLREGSGHAMFAASCEGGRRVLVTIPGDPAADQLLTPGELLLLDSETETLRSVDLAVNGAWTSDIDASCTSIAVAGGSGSVGGGDGFVAVGSAEGGDYHLLHGREMGEVAKAVISPDGKWVAASDGSTVQILPMPDVRQRPFHALPFEELMRRLRTHTNLRVVGDEAALSGYSTELGPFPGWEELPTW